MKIAICDDEPIVRSIVKKICINYCTLNKMEFDIFIFENGVEFLVCEEVMDIIFLDVDLPQLCGFSVAEVIRKRGQNSFIIFLTSYAEMMQKAFKVRAFRYLLKPIKDSEIHEALETIRGEILGSKTILISYKNKEFIIREQDILYIESLGDTSSVYLHDNHYVSTNTLASWLSILDEVLFFQTHKSYIVGIRHVKKIDKSNVLMSNHIEVPVSVRKMKIFKEKINDYIRLKAR